jgi:hypothetical protein
MGGNPDTQMGGSHRQAEAQPGGESRQKFQPSGRVPHRRCTIPRSPSRSKRVNMAQPTGGPRNAFPSSADRPVMRPCGLRRSDARRRGHGCGMAVSQPARANQSRRFRAIHNLSVLESNLLFLLAASPGQGAELRPSPGRTGQGRCRISDLGAGGLRSSQPGLLLLQASSLSIEG